MRFLWTMLAALTLAGCSDNPAPETAKTVAKPPAPIGGREAFYKVYPLARTWAADCQPLRVRSMNLKEVPSEDGKTGAWEVVFVSPSLSRARTFTWSAVEAEGNLHQGPFQGPEESWSPGGQDKPFLMAAFKIDTPDALHTAVSKSPEYMNKKGEKPPVNFILEATPRFPDPAWRVMWGESVSNAQNTVFVDATTGSFLERER